MRKQFRLVLVLIGALFLVFPLSAQGAGAQSISSLAGITGSGSYKLTANTSVSSAFVIQSGWNVTLDFNGYTVSGSFAGRPITNNGTLTLLDSSGGGGITGQGAAFGAITNNATLTIQSGTYTTQENTDGSTVRNNAGATLIIQGGSFHGRRALANFASATLNGGTFTQNPASPNYTIHSEGGMLTLNGATVNGDNGGVSITGGQFAIQSGTAISAQDHYALYVDYANSSKSVPHGTISGGTFTSQEQVAFYLDNSEVPPNDAKPVKISGGTFSGGAGAVNLITPSDSPLNSLVITGGTYAGSDADDILPYVPQGYTFNPESDVVIRERNTGDIPRTGDTGRLWLYIALLATLMVSTATGFLWAKNTGGCNSASPSERDMSKRT